MCVAYKKNATDTGAVVAVDTRNGSRLDWSAMPRELFGNVLAVIGTDRRVYLATAPNMST